MLICLTSCLNHFQTKMIRNRFKYYGMMKKMRVISIHQDNTMVKPNIKTYTILLNE